MSHVTTSVAESSKPKTPSALRQRLLQDITELRSKPYPNVTLHVRDENITRACLILNVDEYGPMHLTLEFPSDYPLGPPIMLMDSDIIHPNIFGSYICASILNTQEGYTPAYTLKGIAIQMLSFFSSDNLEQAGGHAARVVDLKNYRKLHSNLKDNYTCARCNFGKPGFTTAKGAAAHQEMPPTSGDEAVVHWPALGETSTSMVNGKTNGAAKNAPSPLAQNVTANSEDSEMEVVSQIREARLPDEILLLICEKLETEDLMAFAEAWWKIGSIMTRYDVIRTRELQCFCFKKDYMWTKLGVGITLTSGARKGFFESEFDLLSKDAFETYGVSRSVLGVEFEHWLPLPISRGHWRNVSRDAFESLTGLATAAALGSVAPINVIYHFMNDVVVKLNKKAEDNTYRAGYYPYQQVATSTLTHASEKAIESYFHLFHLLLCMATEQPSIVRSANEKILRFMNGETSKGVCPNLGHLLVAVLISNHEITQNVMRAIVKETITRNTVWVLDKKGANMPELAFMESSAISHYRLKKTFEASKTSYRLLMFLNLFRKTAVGSPRKPLAQLCDEAFDRHGAPPRGSAKHLADSIKRIHEISTFPEFLDSMGIDKPSPSWFTNFLRTCMQDSVTKGYSSMPLSQAEALHLRLEKEPGVEAPDYLYPRKVDTHHISFFPGRAGSSSHSRGRGNGRRR
ncbi:hypothetical protein G7Y89_g223 [Cudoniella acicularis]|uniref:UBC core domain-containing protein n=1 Tax=Cudoniella acicularis TaxID=354080 RepID=A0A8H4RXP6_9HELO|nr:hypothetical protein G7Y89_g223 [Cudoniella acicularis]